MELVILIQTLALIQFLVFGARAGLARRKYGVLAPAVAGHPVFERHYRVQMNTQEQLLVFVPALWAFAILFESRGWQGYEFAASLGVVWLVGRALYARQYLQDPASRRWGFLLTLAPTALLLLGTLIALMATVLS